MPLPIVRIPAHQKEPKMASVLVKDDHKNAKNDIILSWIGIAGRQGLFSHKQELSEFSSEVAKSPSLKIFNRDPLTTANKWWRGGK